MDVVRLHHVLQILRIGEELTTQDNEFVAQQWMFVEAARQRSNLHTSTLIVGSDSIYTV